MATRERTFMSKKTLRERVRSITRSADDQVLISEGFTYSSGALTKDGRKVVVDILFQDPNLAIKDEVVKLALTLKEKRKK